MKPEASPQVSSRVAFAVRAALVVLLLVAGAALVPRLWCGRDAHRYFAGDLGAQRALADSVADFVRAGVGSASFSTGSRRFDAEWAFGTHQMAALGLGQLVLAHPELRGEYLPVIERCAQRLLAPESLAFGAEAWGEAPLEALASAHGHAYLGYLNLALSMLTRLDPRNRFAGTNEAITEALARRLRESPHGIIETYPGEAYPADLAAVLGSIGLFDRARGTDHSALLAATAAQLRGPFRDASGLLHQSVDAGSGRPTSPGRGSGTAFAVFSLSFWDPGLARELFSGCAAHRESLLGFGAVREYPIGVSGRGDIDSGPVVLGVSVSATGFALAGARLAGDERLFTELFRTAELFGVSVWRPGRTRFLSGGPLGNAILLAMLTSGGAR